MPLTSEITQPPNPIPSPKPSICPFQLGVSTRHRCGKSRSLRGEHWGFLWLGTSAFGLRVQTFQFIGLQALGSRAFGLPDNIARVIGLISAGDMIARYLQTSRGCINARSTHSCACLSRKDPVTSAASAAVTTSDQVNTAKMLAIGTAATEVGDGEEASRGGA